MSRRAVTQYPDMRLGIGNIPTQAGMRDTLKMAEFRSREIPRCCGCLTVRSVSLGLALYLLFSGTMLLVLQTVNLAHGEDASPADKLAAYLVGLLLMLVALGLICGILRNLPGLMVPFLALQTLDLSVSVLSFLGLFLRYPSCVGFLNWERRHLSSFMDEDESGDPSEKHLLRPIVYLALAHAALLLLKFYLLQCVWRCYKHLKSERSTERTVHISAVTLPEKGLLLPSYDEALALPTKQPPPPAYSV
ncbi:lysosomal-associated transmembrane protein 5-like [Ambystoma mexicanum]|uniref:lysosomal-associated transmembrane protein 5-like n=1 Tax=Ambystoma mexicanum TaxID=8296 RepID=UPI0037E85DB7